MDYLAALTGLLSKAFKLDEGKITELLTNGENKTTESLLTSLLDLDATRVTALRKANDTAGKFQEGYAKAKKEVLSELEKSILEKFAVDTDKTGLELIEEIVTIKTAESGKGKSGTITDDDVRKHPVYQTLEVKAKKDLTDRETALTAQIEEIKTTHAREQVLNTIKTKALSTLDTLKPILPANADIANNIKGLFSEALKGYDYEIQGDHIVIMEEGKVKIDAHGNSVSFDDLVKGTASKFFEFQQNNGGGNAGNENKGNGGGGSGAYPANITKPTNLEELTKIVDDANIPAADRDKVVEVFMQENK